MEYLTAKHKELDGVMDRVRKGIERTKRKEQDAFEARLGQIRSGAKIQEDIDATLRMQSLAKQKKVQDMHRNWEDQVYSKIDRAVHAKLDKVSTVDLAARRRAAYDEFLDATNCTAGLYLDVVGGDSGYDPFKLTRQAGTVQLEKIVDPTKRVIDKRREERSMVDTALAPPKFSRSRVVLDTKLWHTGKIEATPHGKYAAFTEKTQPTNFKLTASSVMMNHYTFPDSNDAAAAEMPAGKRTAYKQRTGTTNAIV